MISLHVETLIHVAGSLSIERSSMHKVKSGVQNMYMKCIHVHRQEFLS